VREIKYWEEVLAWVQSQYGPDVILMKRGT